MRIISPSYQILDPKSREEGVQKLQNIEYMARISHRSEDKQNDTSWQRFIQFVVMTKGDWSVVEHEKATVIFRVDRGVTHELVRHRTFSYTQESTRFVNYQKRGEMDFIVPSGIDFSNLDFKMACEDAERSYNVMIDAGMSPQIARSVLPNALASTIAVTGNLRSWRHIFIMRTTQETHPDFKRVMIPLLAEFQQLVPLLFDDIIPGQKQAEALSKPR